MGGGVLHAWYMILKHLGYNTVNFKFILMVKGPDPPNAEYFTHFNTDY